MKGLPRALLFGVASSLAPIAVVLLLWPEFFPGSVTQSRVIGVGAALGSAVALWTATRLPAASSWPIAIVGWIIGFCLFGIVL